MNTQAMNITDTLTAMYDGEVTVTPEPRQLYTSEGDARLYYFASDKTWWTIDEDTGATSAAEEPAHLEPGDVDASYFDHWQDTAAADWSELQADQARIDAAKEAIETTPVGYAGVIGRDGWGVCLVVADTIAAVTGAIRLHALESGESPEKTMAAFNVRPVTRRYKSAWNLDSATEFTLRNTGDVLAVDLIDAGIEAW